VAKLQPNLRHWHEREMQTLFSVVLARSQKFVDSLSPGVAESAGWPTMFTFSGV